MINLTPGIKMPEPSTRAVDSCIVCHDGYGGLQSAGKVQASAHEEMPIFFLDCIEEMQGLKDKIKLWKNR